MNTDPKRVIKGLECCMRPNETNLCGECPYKGTSCSHLGCIQFIMHDALSLLKSQEPKPVKDMLVVGGHLMGKCPKCYKVLTVQDHPVACGFCGQKVKWDD